MLSTIPDEKHDSGSNTCISTIYTASESMQLSLPDSFDDNFSTLDVRPNYTPGSLENAEIKLIQAQLYDSQQRIIELRKERENALKSIDEAMCMSSEDVETLKSLPFEERTLGQSILLKIHDEVVSNKSKLKTEIEKAANASEIAMQQQQKIANEQILSDQKIAYLKETLDATKDRYSEAKEKIAGLQSTVIELEEKKRLFDSVTKEKKTLVDDVSRLRNLIKEKEKEMEHVDKNYTVVRSKLKDSERLTQTLELEKSFIEKEKQILLQRAEKSEKNAEKMEEFLREAVIKGDRLMVQLAEVNMRSGKVKF